MTLLAIFVSLLLALVLLGVGLRGLSRWRPRPCPVWLAWLLDSRPVRTSLAASTLERMGLQAGQRVLEVGAGTGRLLIPAARRVLPGGEVVGIDIQAAMIERLHARVKEMGGGNITLIVGDATQAHVPPESFDVVYLCSTLGEIPDRKAALQQCYAALKPGGMLSITETFPDPDYQSRSTVRRLAEACGFSLREMRGHWYHFTANFVKVSPQQTRN